MDMIDTIKEIAESVLIELDMYSDDALALVMRTGMAESGYRALKGYGDGNPALGFWQVEPKTAEDIIHNYAKFRPKIMRALRKLGYVGENLKFELLSNLALQIAFCRLKYRRDKQSIPSWTDLDLQASYWKRVYNTHKGRGTVEHFIDANKEDF